MAKGRPTQKGPDANGANEKGIGGAEAKKKLKPEPVKNYIVETKDLGPVEGLPEGWFGESQTNMHGKTKLVYSRKDGTITNCFTLARAIKEDAKDKKYDPEPILAAIQKKREENLNKERKEELAMQKAFVDKYGFLTVTAMSRFAGWSLAHQKVPSERLTFVAPDKTVFQDLRSVEMFFGRKLLKGQNLDNFGIQEAMNYTEEMPNTKRFRNRAEGGNALKYRPKTKTKEEITAPTTKKVIKTHTKKE